MTTTIQEDFFSDPVFSFSWGDLTDKTVMDIGCGRGGRSTRKFLQMHPNIRSLIGIDRSPRELYYAIKGNSHPKIKYHIADILDWSTVSRWEGQMHTVISYCCFHCFDDKILAFKNVHRLLEPGGTAAIVFQLRADCFDYSKEVGEKYQRYILNSNLEPPESHLNKQDASHYEPALIRIGFEVKQCDEVYHLRRFADKEECKNYLTSICGIVSYIPEERMHKFKEDLFTEFLKSGTRIERGRLIYRFSTAKIVVKKRE